MFFRIAYRKSFSKLRSLGQGIALSTATLGLGVSVYTAFPVPEAYAFEPFDLPDAILQETPSPDGSWIGIRLYSTSRTGGRKEENGLDKFALRRPNERLIRDSDGAVISLPYAGNRGVEIQQISWRDPRNVILTLRKAFPSRQGKELLGRYRGINIWGESTTAP